VRGLEVIDLLLELLRSLNLGHQLIDIPIKCTGPDASEIGLQMFGDR
jgi:hypothetical protein